MEFHYLPDEQGLFTTLLDVLRVPRARGGQFYSDWMQP
jgi:hypothetical protein